MGKIKRKNTGGILSLCAILFLSAVPDPVHGAEYTYEDWFRSLDKVAENLEKDHFYYSVNGAKGTYAKSKASRRVTNCAVYVSWALQDLGILKKGQVFWIDKGGAIRGKNKSCITKNKKVRILHPNKKASKAGLQKGDICGWSSHIHTAVYAGRDAKGNLLWYSAGRDGGVKKNGKWYFKGKRIKAKTRAKRYNGKISTVIRIKNLKKAENTKATKKSVQDPERKESENMKSLIIADNVELLEGQYSGSLDASLPNDATQNETSLNDDGETREAAALSEEAATAEKEVVEEEDSEPEEDASGADGYFQAGLETEDELENLEDDGTDSAGETNGTDFEREETDPELLAAMPSDDSVNDRVVDLDAEAVQEEIQKDSNDAGNTRDSVNTSENPSAQGVMTPETGDEGLLLLLTMLALSGSGLIFLAHHRKPD